MTLNYTFSVFLEDNSGSPVIAATNLATDPRAVALHDATAPGTFQNGRYTANTTYSTLTYMGAPNGLPSQARGTVTADHAGLGFHIASNPEAASAATSQTIAVAAGDTLVVGVYIKCSVASNWNFGVRFTDDTGTWTTANSSAGSYASIPANTWTWLIGTITVPAGSTHAAIYVVSPDTLVTGTTFDGTGLLIARNPAGGNTYFDGTTYLTPTYTYAWTGAEDASTSVRQRIGYEITPYVHQAPDTPMTLSIGRADELSDTQPGTLTLTLDNTDGRFSVGSTLVGIPIRVGMPIRVYVGEPAYPTTRKWFYGYVDSWPVEWPGGLGNNARSTITATDALTRLSRRKFRTLTEEHAYRWFVPQWYYRLDEGTGATVATDTSGQGAGTLRATGTVIEPGAGEAPPAASGTSWNFTGTDYLYASSGVPVPNHFTFAFYYDGTLPTATATLVQVGEGSNYVRILMDTTGALHFELLQPAYTEVFTGAPIAANMWHHLTVSVTPSGSNTAVRVYWNGNAFLSVNPTYLAGVVDFSTATKSLTIGKNFRGFISHVYAPTVAPTTSGYAKTYFDIYSSFITGFPADNVGSRFTRLARYVGMTTDNALYDMTNSDSTLVHSDLTGRTALDALNELATTEAGLLFVRGDGTLYLHGRQYRSVEASQHNTGPGSCYTVPASALSPNTSFTTDTQNVVNTATVTIVNGPSATASNSASIANLGVFETSIGTLASGWESARDYATWLVNRHSVPKPRLGDVTLDLLTLDEPLAYQLVWLDIDDRIDITGLPSQSPVGTDAHLFVEGFTQTVSSTEWSITINATATDLYQAFLLDDPYNAQLDSTANLFY